MVGKGKSNWPVSGQSVASDGHRAILATKFSLLTDVENIVATTVRILVGVLAALSCCAAPVAAQGYPAKPIRIVVPYPPGGGTDIVARTLAQLMTPSMGQQVVVENRGGAGGNIGMDAVAKAPPDGYTLVFAITAQLAVNPSLFPKLPFDLIRDYAPITLAGIAPYLLVVHPSLPAKSMTDFLTLARNAPNEFRYRRQIGQHR